MRMDDCPDMGPQAIKEQMHAQFGRRMAFSVLLLAFHIDQHQVVGGHHAFGDGGGGTQDAILAQPHGNVAIAGRHIAALVQHGPYPADFLANPDFTLTSHSDSSIFALEG